jgi:glutamyl-tRNA reductase
VGTSYRTASIELRESSRFATEDLRAAILKLDNEAYRIEAVVLSTCNRNEVYFASPAPGVVDSCIAALHASRPELHVLGDETHGYRMTGSDAARHLFRVACGLDSSILGDSQILGQVRRSVAVSAECGLIGPLLQRTFSLALGAGARARKETDIGRGAASIGSAVAEMVMRHRREGATGVPNILILGAGEIARDTAQQLSRRRAGRLTLLNRSRWRAQDLAREVGAKWRPWTELEAALLWADIVVTAVSSPVPLLSAACLDASLRKRSSPFLVFDLGMPRNVEAASKCGVVDIDHIRERREAALVRRQRAIPDVERIVAEAVIEWRRLRALQAAELQIKNLYRAASEVSRLAGAELASLPRVDAGVAAQVVLRSIKRLLHAHVRDLREADARWRESEYDGRG